MSRFAVTHARYVCANTRRALQVFAAVLALLVISVPSFSQGAQGTIQGGVFDQSGGAIAGASVTVLDVARGVSRTLVADDAGQFVAAAVNPGTYTVRAEAKGFKTQEHSGVLLEVGQNIRVDLVLQPGEQTETVTVTGEVPSINTTDATMGGTVSNESINSLPLNGRNFERLLQLRPGVVTAVGAGSGAANTNGRRLGQDILIVEGLAALSQTTGVTTLNGNYRGGDASSVLPIDSIQEFNTVQNPKAEYGWKNGSVITVGIKSGTNTIHGTAYAYGRDASATDAANYFSTPGVSGVTPATLQQFGGSVGGRILKDKLFWFANAEFLKAQVGDTQVLTIPTDIPGATNSIVDACNNIGRANVSPLSAQLAGLPAGSCVPLPSSSTFENLFPYNPTSNPNFSPSITSNLPVNNGLAKIDYIPGPKHHFSGTIYQSKSFQTSPIATGTSGSVLLQQWGIGVPQHVYMFGGAWTWTPSSTWVNDFRAGAIMSNEQTIHLDGNVLDSDPWPQGYGINTGVSNNPYGGMPKIIITGLTSYLGGDIRAAHRGPEGDLDFIDTVSHLSGKHTYKAGFEYMDNIFIGVTADTSQGQINFANLAAFLTGTVKNATIQAGNPSFNARGHWYSAFVQDDWRLTPRVTLNMGVRYEYAAPMTEKNNYLGNVNLNVNPLTTPAVEQVGPGAPISALYDGNRFNFYPRVGVAWDVQGNGKTVVRAAFGLLSNPDILEHFISNTPFGANFITTGNTVLACTSGTGPACPSPNTALNQHSPNKLSLTGAQVNWSLAGPVFPVNNPQTINGTTFTGVTCSPTLQCGTGSDDPHYRQPFSMQWNFDVQRAVTNKFTVDLAYVGVHGYRETMWSDLNQAPLGAGFTPAVVTACLANPTTATCAPNAAAEKAARPYNTLFPYLNFITQASNGGYSNYDALQVTAQQRVFHGLTFLAGYTYSHSLDTQTSSSHSQAMGPNGSNFSLLYGNGDSDLRHRLTLSPNYEIPGMKSPGQMLQGWSISSILTLQGSLPWFPSDNTTTDWLGTGENTDQAIVTGVFQSWNYSGPRSAFTAGPTAIPCFSNFTVSGANKTLTLPGCTAYSAQLTPPAECVTAAQAPYAGNAQLQQLALAALKLNGCYERGGGILTPPAYGTIGNAGRSIFRGAPYYNVDLNIAKTWKFRERYSAQLRFEFFNLFNRADFAIANSTAQTTPSGGFSGQFGCACGTPDITNAVLGSGGPRHIQFALKLGF